LIQRLQLTQVMRVAQRMLDVGQRVIRLEVVMDDDAAF
jgi:hypothetical protein